MRNDLIGNSLNPVDDKGRVSLPTRFRKLLSGLDLTIAHSEIDEYPFLRIFSTEDYNEYNQLWIEPDDQQPPDKVGEYLKLLTLNSSSKEIKIDGSYRIRLDQDLRDYAQISDKVLFVGMGSHVVVMSPEVQAAMRSEVQVNPRRASQPAAG